jgi:hypothetical protein
MALIIQVERKSWRITKLNLGGGDPARLILRYPGLQTSPGPTDILLGSNMRRGGGSERKRAVREREVGECNRG